MKRFGFACAALSVFSMTGTAHANWAFTRWGMNPAQMSAASKGALALKLIKNGTGNSEKQMTGTYKAPSASFNALFYFDQRNKLTGVGLKSISGDCETYRKSIEQSRGKPIGNGNYVPRSDGFYEEWSQPGGDAIVFDEKHGSCTVSWNPESTE